MESSRSEKPHPFAALGLVLGVGVGVWRCAKDCSPGSVPTSTECEGRQAEDKALQTGV